MATLRFGVTATLSLYLLSLLFLSIPHLSVSKDIHDILHQYGLPRGLIPSNVKSYTVSPSGTFSVKLTDPCTVIYADLTRFEKVIKGKLSDGVVSKVSGIVAQLPLGWFPVTGVEVSENGDSVYLHAGGYTVPLPYQLFEAIPVCLNEEASLETHSGLNSII